ncbi:unnamed protein product [Urochloa humidicola]
MAPSLLLCFVSPVWAAWSLILMLVAAAPANAQGDCSASRRCGNLTISEPFGIVPDEATGANCGSIGFQVTCQNNTPYLGYYLQDKNMDYYQLQILEIFYGNGSLLVVDMDKLGGLASLNHRDCRYKFPSANTSSKIAFPFSISPINQELILYDCTKAPPPAAAEGLVETRCGNKTLIARVGDELREPSRYFVEGCTVIFVPVRGGSGKANASNYEELIGDGFLLTWKLLPPSAGKGLLNLLIGY